MLNNLVGFILPGGVRRKRQNEDKAYLDWRHAPMKKRADSLHQRPRTRLPQRPIYRAGKGI